MTYISSDYSNALAVQPRRTDSMSGESKAETEKTMEERWVTSTLSWDSVHDFVNDAEKSALQTLSDGVDEMLDADDLKSIVGFTDVEIDAFLGKLNESINNQHYEEAQGLVKDFFSAGSGKVREGLATVLENADSAFWNSLDKSFTRKLKLKSEADSIMAGGKIDRSLEEVLKNVRNEVERKNPSMGSMDDFKKGVDHHFGQAVDKAKENLLNAGRNLYTEDAESILSSATSYMKDRITGDELMDRYDPSVPFAMASQSEAHREYVLDKSYELDELESTSSFTDRYDAMGKDFLDGLKRELQGEDIVILDKEEVEVERDVATGEVVLKADVPLPSLEKQSGPVMMEIMMQSYDDPKKGTEVDEHIGGPSEDQWTLGQPLIENE